MEWMEGLESLLKLGLVIVAVVVLMLVAPLIFRKESRSDDVGR